MNSKSPEYLTVKQVALVLNCSERHVRRLISGPASRGAAPFVPRRPVWFASASAISKSFWNGGRPDNFCHTVSC